MRESVTSVGRSGKKIAFSRAGNFLANRCADATVRSGVAATLEEAAALTKPKEENQ